MTTVYTLAIRDHQLGNKAHNLVTLKVECEGLRVNMESIDAALSALREDLIKSARFYAECAERDVATAIPWE
jgi:hypothetical protein